MRNIVGLSLALWVGACSPDALTEDGAAVDGVNATATVTFGADWTRRVRGTITAGGTLRVEYSPDRLPQCRGETNGRPAWGITGYYRINHGAVQSFGVAPVSVATPSPVTVTLPNTRGALELWFQVSNRWGCNAWDSNYGNNYRFDVAPNPRDPGWIGDGAVVISRATCANGGACDNDRRPITTPWTYDTWSRQRAAIRGLYFDVWKRGVTDRDNPDLWRDLDVRMYSRFGRTGAYRMQYVSFNRRVGDNARYGVDLRAVDPLPDFPALTACPGVPLALSPDGALVSAVFEYYFSVNGVEYRPSPGGVFTATFANYKTPLLATCVTR